MEILGFGLHVTEESLDNWVGGRDDPGETGALLEPRTWPLGTGKPRATKGGHGHNVSPSLWLCTPLRSRLWGSTSCNYSSGGGKLGQLGEVWAARSALAVLSVPNRCSIGGRPASGLQMVRKAGGSGTEFGYAAQRKALRKG